MPHPLPGPGPGKIGRHSDRDRQQDQQGESVETGSRGKYSETAVMQISQALGIDVLGRTGARSPRNPSAGAPRRRAPPAP